MGSVAEKLTDLVLPFASKAGETGKLYGSITTQMIADAISKKSGVEINRRQIDIQPVRTLGDHKVRVRLTVGLIPTITVVVHREGEAPAGEPVEAPAAPEVTAQPAQSEAAPEIAQEASTEA